MKNKKELTTNNRNFKPLFERATAKRTLQAPKNRKANSFASKYLIFSFKKRGYFADPKPTNI